MSHHLLEANLNGVFAVFDTDGDGHITVDDFTAKADQLCAAYSLQVRSPHHTAIQGAYTAWWEQIRDDADSDGDGRVSQAEFVAAIRSGADADPRYLQTVDGLCNAVFDSSDGDGDGRISREEFERIYGAVEMQADVTRVAFDHLDTDGDGVISRQEFVAGVRALLTSADLSQPGTWMVGETSVH
jgi:Ca2+-binding EF-hand superfamily protein